MSSSKSPTAPPFNPNLIVPTDNTYQSPVPITAYAVPDTTDQAQSFVTTTTQFRNYYDDESDCGADAVSFLLNVCWRACAREAAD